MKGSTLTIEVLGIGFPNKGAELMLDAIRQWSSGLPVSSRLVVRWDTAPADRLRKGLWAKPWHPQGAKAPYGSLGNYLPGKFFNRLAMVRDKDVDIYLDASGYAYGDPWGAAKAANRLGENIAGWRAEGKPVILLPQAFGPFVDPALRVEMARICQHANRIYARDQVSLQALNSLGVKDAKISRGLDFTCLVKGRPFEGIEAADGAVGLIPNHKMYALGAAADRGGYLDFFVGVASGLLKAGRKVVLILHEGDQDRKLCDEIRARAGGDIPILAPVDAREVKMAIGTCSAVLTSRFHGFASALFQAVPVLATSWSHKYEELAGEFDMRELVLDALDAEAASQKLLGLADPVQSEPIRQKLAGHAARIRVQVGEMWREIESEIQPVLGQA